MPSAPSFQSHALRAQLDYRHRRLQNLSRETPSATAELVALIRDVESAIERIDLGGYGICDQCHDPIEPDYLRAYPTARICLSHLSDDQQRSIERDLELAARVQAQLLPPRDLEASGYAFAYEYDPAGVVSGDYCDVVKHTDGSVFAFLGDVTGKGVSASLLMTQLHAIFRSLISVDLPVADLVQRANSIFADSTLSTHFATLVSARMSADGGVSLVNAGHCPPIIVREGLTSVLPPNGYPLGLVKDAKYTVTETRLLPGDTIFLYTDGLTEGRNATDDEFGEARVLSVLQNVRTGHLSDLLHACRRDHTAFTAGQARLDDLTMLAIRRQATPA